MNDVLQGGQRFLVSPARAADCRGRQNALLCLASDPARGPYG